MMATKATSTAGVKLQRGDGATPTEAFVTIAEVFNISGPNETAELIDVTSFDSPAKEFIAGLRDGGEVSFEYNLVGEDTSQGGLRTDFTAGTKRNFKIDLDDATATLVVPSKYTFAAVVTALGNTFAANDKVTGSCTLKVSGAVSFTARAAS
jgi:predicted secreted protein